MAVFLNVDRGGGPYAVEFSDGGPPCTTPALGGELPDWTAPADADIVYVQFQCP